MAVFRIPRGSGLFALKNPDPFALRPVKKEVLSALIG
jgi:hypothetical protein